MKISRTEFIIELERFINSASTKCFLEIGDELKQNSLNLKQLQLIDYMRYAEYIFDKVITISVLEHIYPEQGGDLQALSEIKRVLKPQGEILLTVPYKEKSNIVYLEGSVYERESQEKNFFAREYDRSMFDLMIENSGLICKNIAYICEQTGILSLDYYQWGPGKGLWYAKYICRIQQVLEKVVGHSIDGTLAERYLHIRDEVTYRVVNVAVVLKTI